VNAIICLAGGIAAGKTTLAQALTDRWPHSAIRSFGDVVRDRARADGLPTDRASLQQVGTRLIAHGWRALCDRLLAELPAELDVLIIDGVRHTEPVYELRRRYPATPVYVVLLQPPPEIIAGRLAQRGETTDVRDHTVESVTGQLAVLADLAVDTTRPVTEIATQVHHLVKAHRPPAGRPAQIPAHPRGTGSG
jgi:chloramphenicol 3-O-phosphotransferase